MVVNDYLNGERSMLALILVVVTIYLVIYIIRLRNNIVMTENSLKRSWSDVASYSRQRCKILDSLEPLVKDYISYESKILTDIIKLREDINKLDTSEADIEGLSNIEKRTNSLMSNLRMQVENYPNLKADRLFLNLMDEITSQNENVGAAIVVFNNNVEAFNNQIEIFPNNIINDLLLHKKKRREFTDSATRDIEFYPGLS